MCGEAYKQSALIAKEIGAFKGFAVNREPMLSVMTKHSLFADKISDNYVPNELLSASREVWKDAIVMVKSMATVMGRRQCSLRQEQSAS